MGTQLFFSSCDIYINKLNVLIKHNLHSLSAEIHPIFYIFNRMRSMISIHLPCESSLSVFIFQSAPQVGINPSLTSAHVGHHYAGPGNHFWACVSDAHLVPSSPVSCYDDLRMLEWGIGFTNVCTRPTKGAAELTRKELEIPEGAESVTAGVAAACGRSSRRW